MSPRPFSPSSAAYSQTARGGDAFRVGNGGRADSAWPHAGVQDDAHQAGIHRGKSIDKRLQVFRDRPGSAAARIRWRDRAPLGFPRPTRRSRGGCVGWRHRERWRPTAGRPRVRPRSRSWRPATGRGAQRPRRRASPTVVAASARRGDPRTRRPRAARTLAEDSAKLRSGRAANSHRPPRLDVGGCRRPT